MDPHHKKGHLSFKIRINMAFKVEKNLAGEIFFIEFLAKLDNSKSFDLQKGHKGQKGQKFSK